MKQKVSAVISLELKKNLKSLITLETNDIQYCFYAFPVWSRLQIEVDQGFIRIYLMIYLHHETSNLKGISGN